MKKSLQDLGLTIQGGQIAQRLVVDKTRGEKGVVIPTIVAKTIKNGYLSHEDVVMNEYRNGTDAKKLTTKGDVIIKLTQPLGACLIGEGEEGMLVTSFCAIINGFDENVIDPRYLVAFLNSKTGMQEIASRMGGSTIQTISLGSLKALQIPVPELKIQKEIISAFEKKIKVEKLALSLSSLYQEKLDAMIAEEE